jgi:hypothetical protein
MRITRITRCKTNTLITGNGITISENNTINSIWRNSTIYTSFASVNTSERVLIGALSEVETLLQLTGNSTNGGTLRLEYLSNTPTFEMIRTTGTTSSLYNWSVYNDDNFKIASKNLAPGYSDRLIIAGSGDVVIATTPDLTYRLTVGGSIKSTDTISAQNGLTSSNGVGTDYVVITRPLTTVGSNTLLTLLNDNGNGLRLHKNYIPVNDYKYSHNISPYCWR